LSDLSSLVRAWLANPGSGSHLEAAQRDLNLTPQERYLYRHHLANLSRGGKKQPGGAISTIKNWTVGLGGRSYVIPSIWNNRELPLRDSIQQAHMVGLHNFPSYATDDEAEKRYDAIHGYMEKDMLGADPVR